MFKKRFFFVSALVGSNFLHNNNKLNSIHSKWPAISTYLSHSITRFYWYRVALPLTWLRTPLPAHYMTHGTTHYIRYDSSYDLRDGTHYPTRHNTRQVTRHTTHRTPYAVHLTPHMTHRISNTIHHIPHEQQQKKTN